MARQQQERDDAQVLIT
jgi:hypothetical protein